MSVNEDDTKDDKKKKEPWNLEDWLFHILLLFAIAIIPIATVILIFFLPSPR